MHETSAEDLAIQVAYASKVVIVPGYGLAVAQAQHIVKEVATKLESRGVQVKYGIHPVAGRMPGHMNVLLAEADVPYDLLKDMDEINPEFTTTDVVLIIGANDEKSTGQNGSNRSYLWYAYTKWMMQREQLFSNDH